MSFVLETAGQILSGAKAVSAVPTSSMALAEGRGEVTGHLFLWVPIFMAVRQHQAMVGH